ncbi:acyl-CoA dehydrogenase family protein [Robiginitomaculum antarcticum]|uniref:acyl-CoA dehydrogenase family protein n=1 Tax=Robiginitomaculum antarcticum TaxID=437507 RepID=UPI000371D51F|nr:acyl-CoA dehydrogenase family protein [Robiginitomaculum antarcticum]
MSDLKQFRAETRAWLEENCPKSMRAPVKSDSEMYWGGRGAKFQSEDQKLWFERMLAKGWTVPSWDKKYGGAGLNRAQAQILKQEMKRINARNPLPSFGIWMLGPALLKFGSEDQKLEFLPPIARGEIRWCQGYSEPGAGSDLASLATKAEDKGDYYLVNGQKVWTSYADQADWIFCLVRTDNSGTKHQGISFVLFDMESEGVETRPIKLISGKSPFCETFMNDVKVPKENLVGEEGQGWNIAKYLLTHEREMIGESPLSRSLSEMAVQQTGTVEGKMPDPYLRGKIAEAEIDDWAMSMTMARMLAEAKAGASLGANSSMLKYYGTELNKRKFELLMDAAGHDGLEWESERSEEGNLARTWLRTKGNSIEGGTSEVQLNIISKHILQLPGA